MDRTALRQRNLKAFQRHQPALAKLLKGISTTVSVVEYDVDEVAQNISIADTKLYPAPAVEWTAGQMRGFLAEPPRIVFPDAAHTNLSGISFEHYKSMVIHAKNKKFLVANAPVIDSGYVFVYGVGLGYHIEDLVEKVDARHLILLEPVLEFLVQSLSTVDWSKIFRLAKRKQKTLHFLHGTNSIALVRSMEAILSNNGTIFIEGSYSYFHYYSWILKEINEIFSRNIKNHYVSLGFFEDEVKMVTNAAANAKAYSFSIVENGRFIEQFLPVFIIGSGPSLDNDLEYIKKWRDRVLLMSSGTSLGILLKHGLRPDIHTEVENGELTWTILSKLAETYDLSEIILAASLTVDPRVPGLFNHRWFYFRGALSSSRIMMQKRNSLAGCEPTVTNTSFAIAGNFGFRDIYLFGVDCGYPEQGDRHHSKDSIYYGEDAPYEENFIKNRHNRLVPGNFGGTFRTQFIFDQTARCLSGMQRRYRCNLFNCSNGARIEDTVPKAAAAIDLSHIRIDRQRVLDRLRAGLVSFEKEEMVAAIDAEALIQEAETYRDAFRAFVAEARARKDGFWQFSAALAAFDKEMAPLTERFQSLARGTIETCLRAGAYLGNRMAAKRQRQKFLDHFYDTIPGVVDEMCERGCILFRNSFGRVEDSQQAEPATAP